jgi:deazaflavin-dependent oxidoreductase (nitroreductase family)
MSNNTPVTTPDDIQQALSRSRLIDITTTGRRSGQPRRIELTFHRIDGRIWISGMPSRRTRGWIHNLEADSRMTLHLKGPVQADLPARGRVVRDPAERRHILERVARIWNRTDVDRMVEQSPLIEVVIEAAQAA